MYMKLDIISVYASRYKTEETRAFEVVFKETKTVFTMSSPCRYHV